jgi:PmbA protein
MNIDTLFARAKEKGLSDVQVFLSDTNHLSIEIFDGELDTYEISDVSTMVVKGLYKNKMGTYRTEVLDDSMIDEIVDKVLANAKAIDSDDESEIYPGDDHYEKLDDLFNRALPATDPKKKIDMVKKLDKRIHAEDDKVSVAEAQYTETTRSVMLQNTKGLKLHNKVNSAMLMGEAIVKDDKDQRTSFDVLISNDLDDFDIDDFASSIVEKGIEQLGSKPIDSGEYEIVYEPDAFATLLAAFQGVFSAEAVQKGYSLLKGKLGETIGSEHVTLVDDPFMKKSSRSRSFDDEGVATKFKRLIDAGTLNTYLHNLQTAKKDNVTSTGNGFGGSVAPVNLKLMPGNDDKDTLVTSVKKGLLVTSVQGAHAGANPVSGDFSLQATGFLLEDGKKVQPVALVTVAGNFIDMLKDVTQVANDSKTGYFGITNPSVKIKSMRVSGN